MTTFEHIMLGVNGTVAVGLNRRYGWQMAAMAGAAAASPDWDGLTLLFGASVFADAHRVWGHNLLACVLLGTVLGLVDYRCDLATRFARHIGRLLPLKIADGPLEPRRVFTARGLAAWIIVSIVAGLSHLLADAVFSGTRTLSDWELQPFWPFSARGWVYPMVPWGDVGVTLVFVAGMFAMLRWKSRTQTIAGLTLLGVAAYIAVRGTLFRNW